uniref:Golgi apparatus protein 1-like n=1 Tax=Hirondellea gigas TaxID=1518452 RepID=A0A2P2I582_9CRUS
MVHALLSWKTIYLLLLSLVGCIAEGIPEGVPETDASLPGVPLGATKTNRVEQGVAVPNGANEIYPSLRKPLARKVIRLAEDPECFEDFKNLCGKDVNNNFSILECIQNKGQTESDFLSQKCHHLLWTYKMNLTTSGRIEGVAREVCVKELERFPKCQELNQPGHTLACMTQHLNELQDEKCHQYLLKLASIIFSDYRLVSHMTDSCNQDIELLKCGRLQPLVEPSVHSQGYVIECLSKNTDKLSSDCHQQILRLAELQGDDFHLDRPLYFACRDDRENFCRNIKAGNGRVYKCLMKHKLERTMTKECVEKLSERQHLVQEDYQVSQGLAKSCKTAIQNLNCRPPPRDGLGHYIKLSVILLCLEDGLRRGGTVDTTCQEEMLNHRRMLLEDYQLSPDLVVACKGELKRLCGGGKELGGRTLHCLMKHARLHPKKGMDPAESKLAPQCKRKVEETIKISDAGEDWRIDPVLHDACQAVVERACPTLLGGQARVMRCLMRHLGTPIMTGPCESALLEIQYFVARDWKLDPQLYSACYNDSVTKCHAKTTWATFGQDTDPERGVLVLPCLFRYTYQTNPDDRLIEQCAEEVRRVMHERAAYVNLHPDIEGACMKSLAMLCSDKTKPGEELYCLQENLNTVSEECRAVVFNYTVAESQDVQLNSLVSIHCATIIPQLCGEEAHQSSTEGQVMECLVRHKNSPAMRENAKCRGVVENFQILTLQSISFTPKFKKECHDDVSRFCSDSKTKKDVVDCLSKRIRDDLLQDDRPQVSRGCRSQLRNQLLQRHTSARLDPELRSQCRQDMQAFCSEVPNNTPQVMECLRGLRKKLSQKCHEVVFVRAQEELQDPGTDPVLLTACKQMIKLHCDNINREDILTCLKRERNSGSFDRKCRRLVVSRMIEQNSDARLNPELLTACHTDIIHHCAEIFAKTKTSKTELNGKITDCLQGAMIRNKLTADCSLNVVQLSREAAINYKMDPQLTETCTDEISLLCQNEVAEENSGGQSAVEECLKLALEQSRLTNIPCMEHVAEIIETQRADLLADPVLHRACAIDDTKFCAQQETGQHLSCLFEVLNRNYAGLERQCRELLRKRREMFKSAVRISHLESLNELVESVVGSNQRNFFFVLLCSIVGVIFVFGLFCGRTSRKYKLLKNR